MSHTSNMMALIRQVTNPLKVKLNMLVTRVVINAIQDAPGIQTVTLEALAGEVFDEIEHMQQGGITHAPLKGAEAVMLALGGSRENLVVLAASNREFRPKNGKAGETIMHAAEALDVGVQARIAPGGAFEVVKEGGAAPADDFVAMALKTKAQLQVIVDAIVGGVPIGGDGGVALQSTIVAALTDPVTSVASTTLKADN